MHENRGFKRAALLALAFVACLAGIEFADRTLHLNLYHLGVYPRDPAGLTGILYAPLIHGSWEHLLTNSFALLILGTALLYAYPRSSLPVLLLIYLLSGSGVWLFARESYHYGASGLTHGIMFFIFCIGLLRRDPLSISLGMIVFFVYGGMVWSIFPQEPEISYESHFFGAASGVLGAVLFRNRDPRPAEKEYHWEDDAEEDTEPPDNER